MTVMPKKLVQRDLKRCAAKLNSPVDICHVTAYNKLMIKTFADKHTQEFYEKGKSKRFPPDIGRRVMRKLEYIDFATVLDDLKVPPSNRLHELSESEKDNIRSR